ncbi:MAG: hypothetical protein GY928_04125, partial [Colwellia sp.]|nr:hypothetical protein [Colwellia sp.]
MLAKAIQTLGTSGLHPFSPQILAILRDKHPVGLVELPPRPEPAVDFEPFSPRDVQRAVGAFHTASAPGASRLRPSHFKDALNIPTGDQGSRITTALAHICTLLALGQAPPAVAPWLAGAPLYPLRKANGGVRPIAVGETLRRIVSRVLCARHKPDFAGLLLPAGQVGVGIPSGAEAAVFAVREKVRRDIDPTRMAVLKLDLENAFNSVSRTTMLHCVARHIPDLLPWATFCYSQPVHLFGEGGLLPFKSSSGVQQGDPLGPFLFSLCLRQCCLRLRDELRDTLSVWYLDDGTLVGPVEQVRQGWDIVLQELDQIGLKVNLGKTEWFAPGGHPAPHPGMESLLPDGFALLGSPIGTPAYCDSFVAERIQKIRRCAQEMDQVKDPQIELALLKFCILMPKFNFALR